jgi:catechol 2,3-dioxygenase-like lactoylglutathione lyase family enzyme
MPEDTVNVRYMVHDVDAAVDFYTKHFGFTVGTHAAPAFADVFRGNLRILLSGPSSSAGRPMPDGTKPGPGGWNRVEFVVDDIEAEVERLRAEGVPFRNDIITGPGGKADPARGSLRQPDRAVPPRRRVTPRVGERFTEAMPRCSDHPDDRSDEQGQPSEDR